MEYVLNLPKNSAIEKSLPIIHYSDCFKGQIISNEKITVESCVRYIFYHWPKWVMWLLKLRDVLIKPIGLTTSTETDKIRRIIPVINIYKGAEVGLFTVHDVNEKEVILFISDKHLDASLSVFLHKNTNQQEIYISTVVMYHNIVGRLYFFIIKPFHIIIVKDLIRRIVKHFNQ